jgi:hypothetical protein
MPPLGWWLTLSDEDVGCVAAASGLTDSVIQRMLLRRNVGTVWREGPGLHDLRLDDPVRPGEGAGAGLVRSRDAACLPCLAENGAWRTSWCLPVTVVCVRHAVYLTRSCLHCGRRLLFPMISYTRTREGFCVFPHEPIEAVPVRDPVMLRAQQLVDRYANAVGDAPRTVAAQWFDRLRKTVDEVARNGELGQLQSADELIRERFAAWCERRAAPARGFGTDLPLMAAMMRLAVGIGGRSPVA